MAVVKPQVARGVEEQLLAAIEAGTAHRGGPRQVMAERAASKTIAIRMPVADIERARLLSAKKGLGYQTYMKMLLHDALGNAHLGVPIKFKEEPAQPVLRAPDLGEHSRDVLARAGLGAAEIDELARANVI